MASAPEVAVIGSGPNGLVAAVYLARAGFRVAVLEAHSARPGGAMVTEASTLPGFLHDLGPGFFPFAQLSPAFLGLKLEPAGLSWAFGEVQSCHVALDGTHSCLFRSEDAPASFGHAGDEQQWARWIRLYRGLEGVLLPALFSPPGEVSPWLRVPWRPLLRLGWQLARSTGGLSRRLFESEAARRTVPALALHSDVGPDDFLGAPTGFVLAAAATTAGFAVPRGGARSVTNALVTELEAHGGRLKLGARVVRVKVAGGRAVAIVTDDGQEMGPFRAIIAATGVKSLLLDLVEREALPGWALRGARRFRHGWGTFKVDFALSGAVPWAVAAARRSAVVHTGESVADLACFTREVRAGKLPERPYLVIGQQSLVDPSRAPPGEHTLYCYTHVPSQLPEGWAVAKERMADTIERTIEGLAPGFSALVKARSVMSPVDLEASDANLVGGDLGGGSSRLSQQLIFRPFFPAFRYRMPVAGLYLASSASHPGGGVHGMCGYNAAQAVISDLA